MTLWLKFKIIYLKTVATGALVVAPIIRHLGSLLLAVNITDLSGVYEMKGNWVLRFEIGS